MDGFSISRFSLNDDSEDELSMPSRTRVALANNSDSHPQTSNQDIPEYEDLRAIKVERFSSALRVVKKKSSANMVHEFVWSKQVGNIELFKSQQIFYKLFQKSTETRAEANRISYQR